ncbi:MAG TPA: hypothetical protein DHV36_13025 [Desulfobacteraceae bacterium]|nr:hypothetical protein [Desulfobacteraceae bacterium]
MTRHILISRDFFPEVGGAHTWMYETYRRWRHPVTVFAGDNAGTPDAVRLQVAFDRQDHGALCILRRQMADGNVNLLSRAWLTAVAADARAIYREVGKGPCMVHSLRAFPEGIVALAFKLLFNRRAKLVTYVHGEELNVADTSRQIKLLAAQVLKLSDLVIANSRSTRKMTTRFTSGAVDAAVIHPGVDINGLTDQSGSFDRQSQRAAWGADDDTKVLITMARHEPRKNQAAVIRSMASLKEKGRRLLYIIASKGPETDTLKAMARDLGLEAQVIFTGFLTQEQKKRAYAAADIHIMPSIECGPMVEGFGIVFIEAAAAGLPSIAGNSGGQAEAVKDGVTGLVVDGTRDDEVATAIETLITERNLYRRMQAEAPVWAGENTWDAVALWTKALTDLLDGKPTAGSAQRAESFFPINVRLEESMGIRRTKEPLSVGIPLPVGTDVPELALTEGTEHSLPCDTHVLSRWPGGSPCWVLIDTNVSLDAGETKRLTLRRAEGQGQPVEAISLAETGGNLTVDTGATRFCIRVRETFNLFQWVVPKNGKRVDLQPETFRMEDKDGNISFPQIFEWALEHDTALRKTLVFRGGFLGGVKDTDITFASRVHFYARKSHVKVSFTLTNPRAAHHPGNAWDLGDPGALQFKDLSFVCSVRGGQGGGVCRINREADLTKIAPGTDYCVYQESSGGDSWQSRNHVNAENRVPLSFRGYRCYAGGKEVAAGLRASPEMSLGIGHDAKVTLFGENFWQNFPKSMEIRDNSLSLGLFPRYFEDGFELQPGERKTHTFYLSFGEEELGWTRAPLLPVVDSAAYFSAMTRPRPVPDGLPAYDDFIQNALEGPDSFSAKNEAADEFGWRSFGDLHADHEAVNAGDNKDFISHYNNQYDVVKGLAIQFMRTGDREWFRLAAGMADHVSDIDIYHTADDKSVWNSGMFWHTDHHLDAATSSHRTISKAHEALKPPGTFGGGPSPDHNYATGLMYLYWMTGEERYREAVIELAGNIISCVTAPDTLSESLLILAKRLKVILRNRGARHTARYEDIIRYEGPSRVSGNSLNTLMDAWQLTGEARYLTTAEYLVVTCVSPDDDLEEMDLADAERRWMYLIFLQALGRYLDLKRKNGLTDAVFAHGRAALIHYASWMADNESLFLDTPDQLEFPTETWAAQEVRKADIFAVAADYAPARLREIFIRKSRYFFEEGLKQLGSFDTRTFTRPMAILLSNGMPSLELHYREGNGQVRMLDEAGFAGLPRNAVKLPGRLLRVSLRKEIRWIKSMIRSYL